MESNKSMHDAVIHHKAMRKDMNECHMDRKCNSHESQYDDSITSHDLYS